MTWQSDWNHVNIQMIAKTLQELSFEQVLLARRKNGDDESTVGLYELTLFSGVVYTFKAWRGVWTDLKVNPEGILRNGEPAISAGQLYIDCQKETGMDDIILANFLEEMHNTLYADLRLLARSRSVSAAELASWSGEKIQTFLKGHPKLLQNKGRIGWSAQDQDIWGPENERPVQFYWLAVKKDLAVSGISQDLSFEDILADCMTEFSDFAALLEAKQISLNDYFLVPIHPWQWERYIKTQYGTELAAGDIQFLGAFGDLYLPQISLRTFSNISRPEKLDIKLPLTILNTSAIRGIPGKYMKQGPALSSELSRICASDKVLNQTQVLEEKAGVSVVHPIFSKIKGAPYRYHELLGVLWRQSSQSKINSDENAIIAGSLFHRDEKEKSLIGAYIAQSGLSIDTWLRQYFDHVFIPLYHLQAQYGIGLVAHGQNVVVRIKDGTPTGLFLKDFQGDLRLTDDSKALAGFDLTRLPRHYLIHDLLTGHLVTVLRFISETLQECDSYPEVKFYQVLGQSIESYLNEHPEIRALSHFKDIDLLQENFHRVLVNKVRFKIGYADSAERPVPILGDDLKNPIFRALQEARS